MHRKELFYYVTSGSNVMRDVHWCVTVTYQQVENDNIANQIHGFTIDDGKFILTLIIIWLLLVADITLALISYRYLFPMSSWWPSKQYHNNVLYVFPSQGKGPGNRVAAKSADLLIWEMFTAASEAAPIRKLWPLHQVVSRLQNCNAREYMKDHVFELRTKRWRHDGSSQLYTQLLRSKIKEWEKIPAWTEPMNSEVPVQM